MNRRESGRALRPYAPVATAVIVLALTAVFVSPAPRARESTAGSVNVPLSPDGSAPETPGGEGDAASGSSTGDDGTNSSQSPGSKPGTNVDVAACPDRTLQVPGDPYSPPCLNFAGDNGGITSAGVSADEIVVSVRIADGPTAVELFAKISGENVEDSPESYVDTLNALGEYFSTRFQFYGRRIRFEIFQGQGVGTTELLGGGREAALSDAVKARELGAFADLSSITLPYADAIARQKIVGIGAPYPSQDWFVQRRPYAWSQFPDGTLVSGAAAAAAIARLSGQDTAVYAGDALGDKPRVFGLVAPENAEYQESADRFVQGFADGGIPISVNLSYKLDIASMPNQASNIIAQLKDQGVTTVVCACDPVMLALGMAPKANEQSYEPEWLTGGLAFLDQDIVAQLIDDRQWRHAFGLAFNAESEPQGRSFPYAAYKQIRPNDEPAFGVEEIYYQMYMLALGIQLAGPTLTPESFEAGMFSYRGGSGPRGFWKFGPGDYTPTDDFREIWWDPDRISGQNQKPGAWVQLGTQRWTENNIPRGPAPFFQRGAG